MPDPNLAVTVAVVLVATGLVLTVNVADVKPAAMFTEEGTAAEEVLDDRVTVTPDVGAKPFRLTVPVAGLPPTIGLGAIVTPARLAGVTVRVALLLVPLSVAVIVAVTEADWPDVAIAKVAEVAPAGTVTIAGTEAAVLSDVKLTEVPPAGATRFSVTVPVVELPPTTVDGDKLTPDSSGVRTVSVADCFTPLKLPVIVAVVVVETAFVLTVKVPVVEPAATVTDAGTVALVLLEDKATAVPPLGAGPLREIVP